MVVAGEVKIMKSRSLQDLETFFASAEVARKATRNLSREAEVAVALDGGEVARFTMESGEPRVVAEAARDPDFTLTLPATAVERIVSLKSDDVGEFGVEFFKLALSKDPTVRARIRIDASTLRILGRGYLGVLASGGMKVTGWLLKNGVRNPKAAIDRLRGAGPR
jgi:hypothetical protein